MTLAGKAAVRRAFENSSGMQWESLRCEFISIRVEQLFDPCSVDDLDAGGLALDMVRRAYLQGLRDAEQVAGQTRAASAERERRGNDYTTRLMTMFQRKTNPEWVSTQEQNYVRQSVRSAYLAGVDEGRVPLGSVL